MSDQWFRWRRPEEGQGYAIVRKEGWFVVAAFTLAVTLALIIPVRLGGSLVSIMFGATLLVFAVFLFFRTVRLHSDWHG